MCREPGLRADFRWTLELVLSGTWGMKRVLAFMFSCFLPQGWGWTTWVHRQGEGATLGLWLCLLTVQWTCCPRVTRQQTEDTHMGIRIRWMMRTKASPAAVALCELGPLASATQMEEGRRPALEKRH